MKPLVGVGTRGLRPGHLKGLFKGNFHDLDAKEAKNSFTQLGTLFLDGEMPPWLCRALTGGLLTPLVKNPQKVPDDAPDARPASAPDSDISACGVGSQENSENFILRRLLRD